MTSTLERPRIELQLGGGVPNGGVPARRAVVRWAWRLFRREWRQQLLVLALVAVALAGLVVGSATAADSPAPKDSGFGTARFSATLKGNPATVLSQLHVLQQQAGTVDLIEDDTLAFPGTVDTFNLQSQNPQGPYGQAMLSLLTGRYPTLPGEVAVTSGVASAFKLHVGSTWHEANTTYHVVGTVQNPQSLLDEFALVAPGQVPLNTSTQITALFDGSDGAVKGFHFPIRSEADAGNGNAFNPETISLALATIGMLLIGLVAVGGFTVLAQRRLRSIGMLEALGATDRHIRLVVRANGLVVGFVGSVLGLLLGLGLWLAYRPHLEASSHHVIGMFQLPWVVLGVAVLLAIVTTFAAASRPARTITRVPIVTALSGRPAPPKKVHRGAIPGGIALFIAVLLLGAAGSDSNGGGALPLVVGLVTLIVGIVLLAPIFVSSLGIVARRAPVSMRLALRDLARYQARSGSAMAAISLGVFIAALVCVIASARYSNVLDYAGPNLTNSQLVVDAPGGPDGGPGSVNIDPGKGDSRPGPSTQSAIAQPTTPQADADAVAIAKSLGSHTVVALDSSPANLQRGLVQNNNFQGALYVETPSLLRAFGITSSEINPNADILSSRPGLDTESDMQLVYGDYGGKYGGGFVGPNGANNGATSPCPKSDCVQNPVIQYLPQLPTGTTAPNTLITQHAIRRLHLGSNQNSPYGWLIPTSGPLTAAQISETRATAAADGLTIETRNDQPTSSEVINWATVAGLLLALGILAMTIGLIRAETASDLRTLAATGASSRTRRNVTAATAGALGLLGAMVGTGAAYLAAAAYFRSGKFGQGVISNLSHVPALNLFAILVAMPLVAAACGWLLAGRQPPLVSRQPIE
jgi:putative ABC transport system permease protein